MNSPLIGLRPSLHLRGDNFVSAKADTRREASPSGEFIRWLLLTSCSHA